MFEEGKRGLRLFGFVYETPRRLGDNLCLYDYTTLGDFIL